MSVNPKAGRRETENAKVSLCGRVRRRTGKSHSEVEKTDLKS